MKGVVVLAMLGSLSLSADASNPNRTQKARPRPIQSADPPLALPVPNAPPAPEPVPATRLVETILCPERVLAELVVGRLEVYRSAPTARMVQLLNEAEELR